MLQHGFGQKSEKKGEEMREIDVSVVGNIDDDDNDVLDNKGVVQTSAMCGFHTFRASDCWGLSQPH